MEEPRGGRAQCWAPTPYQEPETKEDLGRLLGSPTGGCEGEEGGGAFTTSPVLRAPRNRGSRAWGAFSKLRQS